MIVDHISETVTVVRLPNFEERYDVSALQYSNMKRYNDKVKFEPCLHPVNFKDTIICYKDSTRKRFVSKTYYEPRVKPKKFAETLMIFPKVPEKTFSTCLDYHIDECRKWFKTSMEFKARSFTTKRILKEDSQTVSKLSDINDNDVINFVDNGPGASQIFMPRFNKDIYEDEIELDDIPYHPHGIVNGDIDNNVQVPSLYNQQCI